MADTPSHDYPSSFLDNTPTPVGLPQEVQYDWNALEERNTFLEQYLQEIRGYQAALNIRLIENFPLERAAIIDTIIKTVSPYKMSDFIGKRRSIPRQKSEIAPSIAVRFASSGMEQPRKIIAPQNPISEVVTEKWLADLDRRSKGPAKVDEPLLNQPWSLNRALSYQEQTQQLDERSASLNTVSDRLEGLFEAAKSSGMQYKDQLEKFNQEIELKAPVLITLLKFINTHLPDLKPQLEELASKLLPADKASSIFAEASHATRVNERRASMTGQSPVVTVNA